MAFFPLPASKVNATLFVARIHSALLLFWCRQMGDRSAQQGKGKSCCGMQVTQPGKSSPKTQEKASPSGSLHRDTLGQGKGGPELWQT